MNLSNDSQRIYFSEKDADYLIPSEKYSIRFARCSDILNLDDWYIYSDEDNECIALLVPHVIENTLDVINTDIEFKLEISCTYNILFDEDEMLWYIDYFHPEMTSFSIDPSDVPSGIVDDEYYFIHQTCDGIEIYNNDDEPITWENPPNDVTTLIEEFDLVLMKTDDIVNVYKKWIF